MSAEENSSADYFQGKETYIDKKTNSRVIKVFSGDCHVSDQPGDMMVTVLGSCIAACIRDPIAHVGGMNHFLLPDSVNAADAPMRYGSYAMEQLINDIMKQGGRRERLEIKIFGGGNVIKSSAQIGDKNVKFIREFLQGEGLKIAQEDLGGTCPRRIHYFPDSGKVMMRKIDKKEDIENVEKEEKTYSKSINDSVSHESESNLDLF